MYRISLEPVFKLIVISAIWQNLNGNLDQAKAQTLQEIITTQPQGNLCDRHRTLAEAGASGLPLNPRDRIEPSPL
jgi:hypothetical protein